MLLREVRLRTFRRQRWSFSREARMYSQSLGISADGSEKVRRFGNPWTPKPTFQKRRWGVHGLPILFSQAFQAKDIEAFMARVGPEISYNVRDPTQNTQHFFVAVDPSGGGASAFSIATIVQGANGFMHVRLHAHRLARPQLAQRLHEHDQRFGRLPHPRHKAGDGHG